MTTIKETAASINDAAMAAKSAAEDLGRSAGVKMDQARADTADALHSAAQSVRSTGSQAAASVDQCAQDTARRLDSTSSYIGKHDATDMIHDLRTIVRRHPGTFMVLTASIAACLGYMAATRNNERA